MPVAQEIKTEIRTKRGERTKSRFTNSKTGRIFLVESNEAIARSKMECFGRKRFKLWHIFCDQSNVSRLTCPLASFVFISSKNCIFNMILGSLRGGYGSPVMMTPRPFLSAKSKPSLAWRQIMCFIKMSAGIKVLPHIASYTQNFLTGGVAA